MVERTPEQIRAVGQAKMRQDSAARAVVVSPYSMGISMDPEFVKEKMDVVGINRGLNQTVRIGEEQASNKFFRTVEEDGVLMVHAIAEVHVDLRDEVFGIGMSSKNEYLDFTD